MHLQIFLAAAAYLTLTSSFTLSPTSLPSKTFKTTLHSRSSESASSLPLSRSKFLQSASLVAFGLAGLPSNSVAAGGVTSEDIVRLKKGKAGIDYLLTNWDTETTTCRENGGECKRDAEPVRKYMGLRSTTDPLFQIEKVFAKAKNMDIDPDQLERYYEAMEDYNACMAMSNSMAFISQFGEYNPGGGKDEVLKYLDESKTQVLLAQKNLKIMMGILGIE
ncbi:hypothetical protein TrLO_g14520 [Triparma laevis f. longispina]|uniref:Uncharacterized protein n=1 Tax=Triparma laevis f. longispina TaxID=1714387 RepID=A0A9W7AIX2_9STRA|nr:hypothetical protein TrLO_g14520 [Triparma laevis f. longispina]